MLSPKSSYQDIIGTFNTAAMTSPKKTRQNSTRKHSDCNLNDRRKTEVIFEKKGSKDLGRKGMTDR
jgi:hypothetical protein